MAIQHPKYIEQRLAKRKETNSLRQLFSFNNNHIDFFSNDYLGYAQNKDLKAIYTDLVHNSPKIGATGSRLLAGNSKAIEQVEHYIANIHQADTALIFNSGYDANIGLLSCIASRHDTIIYDEYCHASIIDGTRLSLAKSFAFKHNSIEDLKLKLQRAAGSVFIVVESVYSMDGDCCPLADLIALAEEYKAFIIVDEAHATGVIAENNLGLVDSLSLQNKVFARVHTFGKALGFHGAIVLGSQTLREYLINFSRSFVYTTARPEHDYLFIQALYNHLIADTKTHLELLKIINYWNANASTIDDRFTISTNKSAIQYIQLADTAQLKKLADFLNINGIACKAILSPTVPSGKERLRICLHSFNTEKQINYLLDKINTISW